MPAPELRPLRGGEVIDISINLVRNHFVTLARITSVVAVPFGLLTLLVSLTLINSPDAVINADGTVTGGASGGLLAGAALVSFVAALASLVASAAATSAIGKAYLGETPEWTESLRFAFKRKWSILGLTIVGAVLIGLGFFVFLVGAIYAGTIVAIAFPAMLLEGKAAMASLGRARTLLKGRLIHTFGVLVLGLVIMFVGQLILEFAVGLLGFFGGDTAEALLGFVADVASTIVTVPFYAALAVVLYVDLRVRNEGFDLELLAREVGSEPPPSGGSSGLRADDWRSNPDATPSSNPNLDIPEPPSSRRPRGRGKDEPWRPPI